MVPIHKMPSLTEICYKKFISLSHNEQKVIRKFWQEHEISIHKTKITFVIKA
jgi:hypothetical protein